MHMLSVLHLLAAAGSDAVRAGATWWPPGACFAGKVTATLDPVCPGGDAGRSNTPQADNAAPKEG